MKTPTWLRLLAGLFAFGLLAAACGSDDDDAAGDAPECEVDQIDGDLALYNWAEYIDEEQVSAFAEEYGISYSIDSYDSNEAMQPIVSQGDSGFDVIVPSDYMVSVMIAAGSLMPLNFDAIPNASNLSADFQGTYYDPDGAYSMPYQWGTTGIAVDTAVVGEDFPRTWGLIFDPAIADQYSGKIQLLNDPRETLGAALHYLGYSNSTTSEDELNEARDLVKAAAGNLAAFNTDSADEFLTSGETAIAHGYSGDMFVQSLETEDPSRYVYFVPEEGGTRWIDNFSIAHDAPHPCTSHTFINWMFSAEQGAALTNWNYYNTPNDAAVPLLDEDLLDFVNDPGLLAGGVDSLESLQDTGDFETKYSDAFVEAKG